MVNKGHGRIEERTLVATTTLQGYVDRPGAQQVLQIARQVTTVKTDKVTVEQVYAITSVPPSEAARSFCWGVTGAIGRLKTKFVGFVISASGKAIVPCIRVALRRFLPRCGMWC